MVAPRNAVEEILVDIWSEVLGVENIGINHNFFELGGQSLKATIVISKIHKALNKEVPLKVLFMSPTIKGLSSYLQNAQEKLYSNIERLPQKEYYEASSAQKRMYVLQQFDSSSTAYNMPAIFQVEGEVSKERVEEVLQELVNRHEALRTYFETIEGDIVQKVNSTYVFAMEYKAVCEDINLVAKAFVRSFDLGKAPLFRALMVESKYKTYLLIDMHHIISDGVSVSILIKEFASLYNGEILEPIKLQYKDFAVWQNNFLKTGEMEKQQEYWINSFKEELPVLNLPTDYERPAIQSFEGDNLSFEASLGLTQRVKELAKSSASTMHMVLLSAFYVLLSKYSLQEDIVIGVPVAGRPHAQLENIMGMFVNTLALRNKPVKNKKYIDFLNEVKENSLLAYENQSYQLESLIEKLNLNRDMSRNPLFDVSFNMADVADNLDMKLDNAQLKQYINANQISKFDLTLHSKEEFNKLSFNLEYCSKLFTKDTVTRLGKHYLTVLEEVVNNSNIELKDLDILSKDEKSLLVDEFNLTDKEYAKDKTLHQLFDYKVKNSPNNIAVVFEDAKLSYKELDEKANSLGRSLRERGIKPNSIVGIMLERSLDMIIAMLGVLKAGGAYLPIDPTYPRERNRIYA